LRIPGHQWNWQSVDVFHRSVRWSEVLETFTLDQLRALIAVSEEGSFSAAARKLHRVQSAVSTAMANLETQLGVALREMAKPAGFTINVQTMPHATYLDQVWKKGPFYVGFYNMQPTAEVSQFWRLFSRNV